MRITTREYRDTWTTVLAGGEGRRLQGLTRNFRGTTSRMVDGACRPPAQDNVMVQPQNRGTAILWPLLKIASRDPKAIIVLLPADHHIREEEAMSASLRQAADLAADHRESIYLLGAEPEGPEPDLGYIVPAHRSGHEPATVLRFIEKPRPGRARFSINSCAASTFPATFCTEMSQSSSCWRCRIAGGAISGRRKGSQ